MSGGIDINSLLSEVLGRLSEEGVDVAQKQADQVLGRTGLSKRGAQNSKSSKVDLIKLEKQRSTRKKTREWEWYTQLNPPQPLSNEEHTELAKVVEIGLFAEERLASSAHSYLTNTEIRELRHLSIQGKRAFAKLVKHNLRLVFNWARPFREIVAPDELQDAFQAGVLGLIRGLEGWDYKLGFTLSTYVTNNIRQSIQRWRSNETLTIRVPVHVWTQLSAMGYLKRVVEEDEEDFVIETEETEDSEENIDSIDEKIEGNAGLMAAVRSLNLESMSGLSRGIIDEYGDLELEDFQSYLTVKNINYVIDALPERSALIIRMRYGFDGAPPATLDTIGESLGVTRERVRQIVVNVEAQIAIILLMRSYPTVKDVFSEIGQNIRDDDFWEWLDAAFSEMFPLPRGGRQHFETLELLMSQFPRYETDVAQ